MGSLTVLKNVEGLRSKLEVPLLQKEVRSSRHFLFARVSIDEGRVVRFADASGDYNSIHTDPEAARRAGFERPIVPAMLILSILSALLSRYYSVGTTLTKWSGGSIRNPLFVGNPIDYEFEVLKSRGVKMLRGDLIQLRADLSSNGTPITAFEELWLRVPDPD